MDSQGHPSDKFTNDFQIFKTENETRAIIFEFRTTLFDVLVIYKSFVHLEISGRKQA